MFRSPAGFKKSNHKIVIFLLLVLFIGLYFTIMVQPAETVEWAGEDSRIIYKNSDPTGDDHGFGNYIYPQHNVFDPGEGLFDIKKFAVEKHVDYYIFSFEFKEVTDPWEGRNNFSHQLIHIYFDTEENGCNEPFRPGANVRFADESSWNYHLRLSGWWLRLMRPDDDPQDLIRDLDIDAESSPWDVEEGIVTRYEDNIRVLLPREKIPSRLIGANFYLFVGSFDPFGKDYFRDIKPEKSSWAFASPGLENLEKAPRIIDWFQPRPGKQEEILSDFSQGRPVLKPLTIPEPEIPAQPLLSRDLSRVYVLANFLMGTGILLAIIYVIMKGDSTS